MKPPRIIWTSDVDGRSARMPNGTKVSIAYDAPWLLSAAMTVLIVRAWDEHDDELAARRLAKESA